MLPLLYAALLDPKDAGSALPLVRLEQPQLQARIWLAEVRRRQKCKRPSGFMVVRDQRGIVHATFGFQVTPCRVLEISRPIIAYLPGSAAEAVVVQCIEDLIAAHACRQVRLGLQFVVHASAAPGRVVVDTFNGLSRLARSLGAAPAGL